MLVALLQEQSLVDIEMPGQYMNGDEPSPDGIVFLEGISSNVHVSCRISLHVFCASNNDVIGARTEVQAGLDVFCNVV